MDNKDSDKKEEINSNPENIYMEELEFVPPRMRLFLMGYMLLVNRHGYFIGSLTNQSIVSIVENHDILIKHFEEITNNCIRDESLPQG